MIRNEFLINFLDLLQNVRVAILRWFWSTGVGKFLLSTAPAVPAVPAALHDIVVEDVPKAIVDVGEQPHSSVILWLVATALSLASSALLKLFTSKKDKIQQDLDELRQEFRTSQNINDTVSDQLQSNNEVLARLLVESLEDFKQDLRRNILKLKLKPDEEQPNPSVKDEQQDSLSADDEQRDVPYVKASLERIAEIVEFVKELEPAIEQFSGSLGDKNFTVINESLIRNIISLDDVETETFEIIKKERKEAIYLAQKLQQKLKDRCE